MAFGSERYTRDIQEIYKGQSKRIETAAIFSGIIIPLSAFIIGKEGGLLSRDK